MSAIGVPMRPVIQERFAFLPAIDLLDGEVVRLERGEFASARRYGTPDEVVARWDVPLGTRIHVVDLEASRRGRPIERTAIERLVERGYRVQIGGGIRTPDDARAWLRSGAERLVLGTLAAEDPTTFRKIVELAGPARIIAAVDLLDGAVRISGWEKSSSRSVEEVLGSLEVMGVQTALVTDIRKDGVLKGPSFDLYRQLAGRTSLRIIASGGAATLSDVASLARMESLAGVVVGKALHERRFTYREAMARVGTANAIPERIIPCLDIRGGRVVKGVKFEGLRDAGDPVECAQRYELEGADEIAVLDISATTEERTSSLEVIRRIGESIFIPLTAGGGVRSVEDFRAMLRAGADRVAINTAAVLDPSILEKCAGEFGVQSVVLACDAKWENGAYKVVVRAGSCGTALEAPAWCAEAERLGAGEILLTSIDRDGTQGGYDLDLLREVTGRIRIGVIASGGAGRLEHFREAIETGGAKAVLAASLFHDRVMSVGEVKAYLAAEGLPVRCHPERSACPEERQRRRKGSGGVGNA